MLVFVSLNDATLVNSSFGGLFPVESAGHFVSNFCPLTHWTSPPRSAVIWLAPLVTAQPLGVAPLCAKPSELTKQFQSVFPAWSRTILPSADSKPLGLPVTAIAGMATPVASTAATLSTPSVRLLGRIRRSHRHGCASYIARMRGRLISPPVG